MGNKAISTTVASILMIMITVSLGGVAWMYISGTFTSQTDTSFSIVYVDENSIRIRNDGTDPITSFKSFVIDEEPADYLVSPKGESLVGHWRFDETSGTRAIDSSGNGNNGVLINGSWNFTRDPQEICVNSYCPNRTEGKFGNALEFDGAQSRRGSGRVNITSSDSLNFSKTCAFTQMAWILPRPTPDRWNGIMGFQPTDSPCCYNRTPGVWIRENAKLHSGFGNGTKWCSFWTADDVLIPNSWNHIAVTFDGTSYLVYVDGVLYEGLYYGKDLSEEFEPDNGPWAGQCPNPKYTSMNIGGVDNHFNGTIDEVRVWNRALDEEEVKMMFDIGGKIEAGTTGTIKIYQNLTAGRHIFRLCTRSMCQRGFITIVG